MDLKKDLFYDLLENPQLTLGDLEAVGHSTENSRLFSKDYYKNNKKVREQFTKNDGTFDEKAFNDKYALASNYWTGMTNDSYNKNLVQYTSFDKDNIFVDSKYRTLDTTPMISRAPNVTRDTQSLIEVGKTTPSGRTVEEVAEAEQVLLNPVEVEKGADPIWGDSPNDEWWSNPFSTRVLAKYDSAGYHKDPFTGEDTWHEKDELKVNSNGTHYYEALDGRDIYGRLVLNKFNTLTTDGSWWNQYDFLDSDDLNLKSVTGSITKNLALVGSMFIPYVGWGVAAASVATQMAGLAGTFGKMISGSENSVLSGMEGFAQSWNRSGAKSQYAQQNMLCWENFIDLIGDTTAQLREQRAIFKFVPAIFKGKYGMLGKEGQELFKKDRQAELLQDTFNNENINEVLNLAKKSGNPQEYLLKLLGSLTAPGLISKTVERELEEYLKDYNKIGEKIARAYMVGITVGDSYGEAKEAGATDGEAALMTMGYAAAENALLTTELGRWIFPELKGEKIKYKSIAKAFAQLPEDVRKVSTSLSKQDNEAKRDWMKRLFKAGVEACKKDYSLLNKTAASVLASGLSEGVEEVSEEALSDFSKACFNTYREMTGQSAVLDTWGHNWDWNEAAKRYGMNFAGGLLGGGINAAGTDFNQIRDYSNMTSELAMLHITWMARNNELQPFWDTVSKMDLGNRNLGTSTNEDGTWKVGTKTDNQDLEVKKLLRNTISQVQNIINAEGASLDDASVIGGLIKLNPKLNKYDLLGQLRTEAISLSSSAGKLIKNYNTIISQIVKELLAIDAIYDANPDLKSLSLSEQQALETSLKPHLERLELLRQLKDAILNGEVTNDLARRSLYEATYLLTEDFVPATEMLYVQWKLKKQGKELSELTDKEKEEWHKKYVEYAKSTKSDDIEASADAYWEIAKRTSAGLQGPMDFFTLLKEGQLPKINALTGLASTGLKTIQRILEKGGDTAEVQEYLLTLTMDNTETGSQTPDLAATALGINNSNTEQQDIDKYSQLTKQLKETLDPDERAQIQLELDALNTKDPKIQQFVGKLNTTSGVQNSLGSILKLRTRLDQIFANPELQLPTVKADAVRAAVLDTVVHDIFDAVLEVKKVGFIHPEVRMLLKGALNDIKPSIEYFRSDNDSIAPNFDLFGMEDVDDLVQELLDLRDESLKTINELPNTPIQKILDSFTTSLKTGQKVSDLLHEAIGKLEQHQSDMENVALNGEPEIFDYELALKILKLCRQGIIGARVDNADLGNLFGYNKTLNDLYQSEPGFQKLAEITAEDAQYALQDIDLAIDRLEAMRSLHEVNSGNKLNALNHAAVNKNLIMFNRVGGLITSILEDDDKKDIRDTWKGLEDLLKVLEGMEMHKKSWNDSGKDVSKRKLGLTTADRVQLEKESLLMENAIYEFFNKNIENVKDPEKLAKILDAFNYLNANEGILTKDSLDIDDNAFTWWLASKAALRASDFAAVFSRVMDGPDVEKPVAPIPTLELGVYAGVAAIFNGDMFKYFSLAMTKSIYDKWSNMSFLERNAALDSGKLKVLNGDGKEEAPLVTLYKGETIPPIVNAKQEDLPDKSSIYNSDVIPNFVNALFIEGIAGSGKSTGVFKSIMKILFDLNPEIAGKKLSDYPIFFAHSTKKNADDAVATFDIENAKDTWNFQTFDKKSLFEHFTSDYTDNVNEETGEHQYFLGTDVVLEGGKYKSLWRIKEFSNPDKEVPKVMFIDEWSQYTQPEIAFLLKLSDKFGIQIIAGGDLDQNTPRAAVYSKESGSKKAKRVEDVTIDRNSFPRIQKLGVSMRTGNGLKTENQNKARAWKEHPKLPILFTHIEIDGLLYGDKVYNADDDVTANQLEGIKEDIQKMVDTLSPGEKIGYIYSDKNSSVYKLITSEFKDYFEVYDETSAQGREARYYVVENNRARTHKVGKNIVANNPMDYFRSLYTGITRAELATIVIAPSSPIGNEKMGTITVMNAPVQPTRLIPDGYSGAGIKKYTKSRKESSELAWKALGLPQNMEEVKLSYVPRTKVEEVVTVTPPKKTDVEMLKGKPTSGAPKTDMDAIDEKEKEKEKEKPAPKPVEAKKPAEEAEKKPVNPDPTVAASNTDVTEGEKEAIDKKQAEEAEKQLEEEKPKTILPRGTEIIDNRPGLNLSWAGNILKYNEEDDTYSITTDTDTGVETGRIKYNDLHGTYSLDGGEPVLSFITNDPDNTVFFNLLELDHKLPYLGKHPIGTEIYDASSRKLIGTISGYNNKVYDITSDSGTVQIPEELLEIPYAYLIGKTSTNKYKTGDVITDGDLKYTILEVNKLQSGGYSYKVQKNLKGAVIDGTETVFDEETLDSLLNDEGFELNPESSKFNEEEPIGIDTESQLDYEKDIEEVLDKSENPEEKVTLTKDNIEFSLFGHTFNTFYTGLDFEKHKNEGAPLVPQEGELGFDRIDMGIGLYKIDPLLCANEQLATAVLGDIRNAAMYLSNNGIIDVVKRKIPKLRASNIEIKYAWISKSAKRSGDYAKANDRFTPPTDAKLRNITEGENLEQRELVPLKTLSLIIRTKNKEDGPLGKSILEIPMVTLTSPQTILYKIGEAARKQGTTNPVYEAYIKAANEFGKNPGLQYAAINAVMDFINKDAGKTLGDGYKALADLCKLWLFNNDGIRFIDGTEKNEFNFAEACQNLGVKYVKERSVETPFAELAKNNYQGLWHSLSEEAVSRPEVAYSNIMLVPNEHYISESGRSIEIAAAGHPFVLRWEGSEDIYGVLTDERMMKRYIALLEDPTLPPLVRLEYVSPPEATISEYLEGMADKEDNPYGNSFTAYHILSALYADHLQEKSANPSGTTFWEAYLDTFGYSGKSRNDLELLIRDLDQVERDNPQLADESHSKHLTRVVKLQKDLMLRNAGAVPMMNSALFKLVYPKGIDLDGAYADNVERISLVCAAAGITGVLRKKSLQPGDRVAGVAARLRVDNIDRFMSPEGKPWRIFSKFDSPTFDMSWMLSLKENRGDNVLGRWASYAKFGPRGRHPKEGAPSVWYFDGGYASKQKDYYFAGGVNGKTEPEPKAVKWRKKYASLLAKLGLKDDNLFGDSTNTEAEFLQKVADYWTGKTDGDNIGVGNMAMVIDGKSIFCGNMNDSNTEGTHLPEVYKHLRQTTIEKSTAEPNMYLLNMVDDRDGTNYQVKVEILPDSKTYSIYFLEEKAKPATDALGMPLASIEEANQTVADWISSKANPTGYLKDIAELLTLLYTDIIGVTKAFGPKLSEYEIAQQIQDLFENDEDTLEDVALAMGKEVDYFDNIEDLKPEISEESEESTDKEETWCPIPIGPKKFM